MGHKKCKRTWNKQMKDTCRRDIKRTASPKRRAETWNGLDRDVVHAKTIHEFKPKLDNSKYR